MLPSRTAIWLLTAGLSLWLLGLLAPLLTPWVAGATTGAARWLVYGFDAAVLLLIGLDALLARRRSRPEWLQLRRERPARLSLGVPNEIALHVDNQAGGRVRLGPQDFAGVDAEPAAVLPERFEVGQVAALYA